MKKINSKRDTKFISIFFYLIIAIWLCMAILRTGYNLTKLVIERSDLSFAPESLRTRYFGINQLIADRLEKTVSINKVLLLKEEGTISYFYLRYILYPMQFYKRDEDVVFDAVIIFNRGEGVVNLVSQMRKEYVAVEKIYFNKKIGAYLLIR